ncbi:Tripartite tricarboxylate transporter family receptor [Oligella ureolytica]|uniref:tripartite tricarboxylate transporter substrate binding protein n=1 Tax=Oligella ureolytica TaxID=90244 RepID=UPI000DFDF39E|nr:tripartite tricarboxylate transporter substrate binding protein [Oligella ureolytica]SUA55268.1 Tripartite tricarboxylate transporter family receptor [Oligella ureolytica]
MKNLLRTGLSVMALALSVSSAQAQSKITYPAKSLRLFVPAAPGGPTDMAARVYARAFEEISTAKVAVINQAGGGGVSAFQSVAQGRPDGSVLLFGNSGLHIAHATGRSPYSIEDYKASAVLAKLNEAYVVPQNAPYNTLAEFVEYAKQSSEPITMGIQMGGGSQLKAEALNKVVDGKLRIVDSGSEGQRIPMILSEQIALTTFGVVNGLQYQRSGDVKVLAVASEKTDPAAPEWPTTASANVDIDLPLVLNILIPAKSNDNVTEVLDQIHAQLVETETFKDGMQQISAVIDYVDSAEAHGYLVTENDKTRSLLNK